MLIEAIAGSILYRAKGSGFWGKVNEKIWTRVYCVLGFTVVSSVYAPLEWLPLYAVLWALWLIPDVGTGFASIHGNEALLRQNISERSPIKKRVYWLADAPTLWALNKGLPTKGAGVLWMTIRQSLILPIPFLTYALTGDIITSMIGFLFMGVAYYVGGLLQNEALPEYIVGGLS